METLTRIGVLLTLLGLVGPLRAQAKGRIRVEVDVTEKTGGLFSSEFSSALRRLGDVDVVGPGEGALYTLHVVVLCSPKEDCEHTQDYAVSFALSQPMSKGFAEAVVLSADSSIALSDAARNRLWEALRRYEVNYGMWAARWGRQAYRDAITEMVAELDSKCFERTRVLSRWVAAGDNGNTQAALALRDQYFDDNKWMC